MNLDYSNNNQPPSIDWSLWFYWIIATTSGWLIGNLLFVGIPLVISGVLIAAMQWAVLYKRIDQAWQWFVLSSFTWIIAIIIFTLFFPRLDLFFGIFLGGALGLTQWSILKKSFESAGWWIIISALAWATGLTFMPGMFSSGSLPGALTGITLVIFFRYGANFEDKNEVNHEI